MPFAGNKDYFIQGEWTYSDMKLNMGFNVENIVYGIKRNSDDTLEIILLDESFKEIVNPENIKKYLHH